MSAFLVGQRKSSKELSSFLFKRGIWLVVIELTVVNFAWYFDIQFEFISVLVIWSLGISMIFLSALIYLPLKYILIFSIVVIFGHNLLDNVITDGNLIWYLIHKFEYSKLADRTLLIGYPIVPWIGVMSLGYYLGSFYSRSVDPHTRQKIFTRIGLSAIILFFIVRLFNGYGNSSHWENAGTFMPTLYSFLNPDKYPPSLSYLLMTLGPSLLFLGKIENIKGGFVKFLSVFGRVPFFYYIIHIYAIHLCALLLAEITGFGWDKMILTGWVTNSDALNGYGVDLWIVYLLWITLIMLLYPMCKSLVITNSITKKNGGLVIFSTITSTP